MAAVLGGQPVGRDGPKAPPGTHDFDIPITDGTTIALEVTTAAKPQILRTLASMSKLADRKFELANTWFLTGRHPEPGEPGPQINQIAKRAEVLLGALESAGLDRFDEYSTSAAGPTAEGPRQAIEDLRSIGVIRARSMGPPPDKRAFVCLGMVGGGGSVDPDALNDVVIEESAANALELDRADGDEKHLFVWIDTTSFSAEFSMWMNQPPSTAPLLPSPVTTSWVATWGPGVSFGSQAARLWRVAPPAPWQILEIPPIRQSLGLTGR